VKGIKEGLQKNTKGVSLAQTGHIDTHLLQAADEDDLSLGERQGQEKKPGAPESLEHVVPAEGTQE